MGRAQACGTVARRLGGNTSAVELSVMVRKGCAQTPDPAYNGCELVAVREGSDVRTSGWSMERLVGEPQV